MVSGFGIGCKWFYWMKISFVEEKSFAVVGSLFEVVGVLLMFQGWESCVVLTCTWRKIK